MKKAKPHIIYMILINVLINSCIDPIDVDSNVLENAIVIEAIITNELKHHQINLSRTFDLDKDEPSPEINAEVKIIDASQNVYNFNEDTPGKYISTSEFAAETGNTYQLFVTTGAGDSYTSNPLPLTSETQIGDVNIAVETNEDGVLGVGVFANSFDSSGNSRYYRYEYEETYKIVAPFWNRFDAIVVSPTEVGLTPRIKEEKVCYGSALSTGIIQTETSGFSEDRVTQKLVRFIPVDNPIITHRYSVLIKQYVQSLESYTYFKTLKELSGSESLLSQNQPGFISSNIFSEKNPNEKVLGFFDVSSVSSKRVFFNFRDLFSTAQRLPPYFVACDFFAPLDNDSDISLIKAIQAGSFKYYRQNYIFGSPPVVPNGGPYVLVIPECGDCTTIGTNVVPEFWID
ncbi:DUF4249 domain-containing protein [Flavivirga spongiicola]|uniref:DUF4249 domain-containing protein n=1 Tax=Flavivirga spongiicola TaxID=421621 RepID=A0ABU7XXV0_9FLAO|nr:DUF4249 domain-containing protein [Flavivirga sp. MEBiC05379]MDO5980402.1 DUF4249 domain-containing protein [Flavivirga sp. MEBiC05379]